MRPSLPVAAIVLGLLVEACGSPPMPNRIAPSSPAAEPTVIVQPTATFSPTVLTPTRTPPDMTIDQATGRTDVVLRYDEGIGDYGLCELCGGWGAFQPGPEFTLYGSGTIIVRNTLAPAPPPDGPIIRAQPFMIGRLEEKQVQELLRFALGEGGLEDARERYQTSTDTDDPSHSVFVVRTGTVDTRVEIDGPPGSFEALRDHLLGIAQHTGVKVRIFSPERYQGSLIEVASAIEYGVLARPADSAIVSWPWPGIEPDDFTGPNAPQSGLRMMTGEEVAVLGLSKHGGVVERIYIRGPDTPMLYAFSLWPILPDETDRTGLRAAT